MHSRGPCLSRRHSRCAAARSLAGQHAAAACSMHQRRLSQLAQQLIASWHAQEKLRGRAARSGTQVGHLRRKHSWLGHLVRTMPELDIKMAHPSKTLLVLDGITPQA